MRRKLIAIGLGIIVIASTMVWMFFGGTNFAVHTGSGIERRTKVLFRVIPVSTHKERQVVFGQLAAVPPQNQPGRWIDTMYEPNDKRVNSRYQALVFELRQIETMIFAELIIQAQPNASDKELQQQWAAEMLSLGREVLDRLENQNIRAALEVVRAKNRTLEMNAK